MILINDSIDIFLSDVSDILVEYMNSENYSTLFKFIWKMNLMSTYIIFAFDD